MSFENLAPVFPGEYQEKITQIIVQVLQEEHGETGAVTKRIARKSGALPRAVKNWREGRRAPNLGHFIALSKTFPKIAEHFLRLAEYKDLADRLAAETGIAAGEKL